MCSKVCDIYDGNVNVCVCLGRMSTHTYAIDIQQHLVRNPHPLGNDQCSYKPLGIRL